MISPERNNSMDTREDDENYSHGLFHVNHKPPSHSGHCPLGHFVMVG